MIIHAAQLYCACSEGTLSDRLCLQARAAGGGRRGDTILADIDKTPPSAPDRRKRKHASGDVGDALRSVYDRALDEGIPPEMLDLLGKLD